MLRALFFLYFWLIAAPVFIIATILTALSVIIGCMLGSKKFFSYYPGMIWSKLTCYLALCPVEVRGKEHLQKHQSYVFVSNHQGAFDIFLVYGFLGEPLLWMMKVGLSRIPLIGAACRAAGFVFVDHSSPAKAKRSIEETKRKLTDGASLIVFPEGSRSKNGKIKRFHKGAFQIALDQHIPIVPITLNGPFKVMPPGTLKLYPHRMIMVIHPPIYVDELTYSGMKDLQHIADDVKEVIASALWEEFR
jgi:1-acyl-sn-glycerol-3-phosphate acyltransferase